jgi:hypothetical protein
MKQILLCEICESWSIKRDRLCQGRSRDSWKRCGMLLRRGICRECFLASVWVPSRRGSSGLLHRDGDYVTQKRAARDGGERKHGNAKSFMGFCCFVAPPRCRNFSIRWSLCS